MWARSFWIKLGRILPGGKLHACSPSKFGGIAPPSWRRGMALSLAEHWYRGALNSRSHVAVLVPNGREGVSHRICRRSEAAARGDNLRPLFPANTGWVGLRVADSFPPPLAAERGRGQYGE